MSIPFWKQCNCFMSQFIIMFSNNFTKRILVKNIASQYKLLQV